VAAEISLPVLLAELGIGAYNRANIGTTVDTPMSARHHYDVLDSAAEARAREIAPNSQQLLVGRNEYIPTQGQKLDTLKAAGHGRVTLKDGREGSLIQINPNADAAYYAHELGHGISQKTDAGRFINNARHITRNNPALAKALHHALPAALAVGGAALQEGDDDLIASLAIAAAAGAPRLIDEGLATKNALAIMDSAGMRANLGQRGRLAGGYLSYLAPLIIAGSLGNTVGNYADDYTALYDL